MTRASSDILAMTEKQQLTKKRINANEPLLAYAINGRSYCHYLMSGCMLAAVLSLIRLNSSIVLFQNPFDCMDDVVDKRIGSYFSISKKYILIFRKSHFVPIISEQGLFDWLNITFVHVKYCGRQIHYELGDLPWGKVKKRCWWKFSWFWMTKWLTESLIAFWLFDGHFIVNGLLWPRIRRWLWIASVQKFMMCWRSNESLKYLFVAYLRHGVSISFVIGSNKVNWDAKDWRSSHEHSDAFAPPWIFIFIICCWSPFYNIVWSQEISKSYSANDRGKILKYMLV